MDLKRKLTKLFSITLMALLLFSCEENRCVEADEFDVESVIIESKPTRDGIFGTYDHQTGGQRANWHDTGLRSNGEMFVMSISGQWTSWDGSQTNVDSLNALPRCNLCAKKPGVPNCICRQGQAPVPETCADGNACTTFTDGSPLDCSSYEHQANKDLCTCTNDPQYGDALDYGVYHIVLDVLDKDENEKIGDRQNTCKLDRGAGAYIALFGASGQVVPSRIYHLMSDEETCNVIRNSNGQCLDAEGNDITKWVFKSANDRIFMKDDKADNDGTDTNTSDDEYHGPNERVKVIIYDNYYYDNYGKYNLYIYKGVGNDKDTGLIEFIVRLVEDVLLGEENSDGQREGGMIEFMYKSIVQDSGFVLALHIALSVYISIYGLAVIFGVAEVSKKELLSRVLKIGLILFFTSADSWYFYDQIVVGFFKDSMDYVVSMIMSLSDQNVESSSMITIAQMDRASDYSNATRFSYVDLIIKRLLAEATTMKIFGLFFGTFFGIIYIPIIYALIGYFIYVMLTVGVTYIINLIKIIFVLSLGPIFFTFTLFSQTASMFNKWLAFLGARSIEIIILFTVLYNFLLIIDKEFTAMLSYRACVYLTEIIPPILVFHTLKSHIDRSLVEWVLFFVTIGGLIFITQLVVAKVGDLAASLISISGESGGGGSSFGLAGQMMGEGAKLGYQGASKSLGAAFNAASYAVKHGGKVARHIPGVKQIGQALSYLGNSIERNTGVSMRNSIINSSISQAQQEAKAKGLRGASQDQFIRERTHELLRNRSLSSDKADPQLPSGQGASMRFAGINTKEINKRLDKKLIDDPLRDVIKAEAKKLKSQYGEDIPLGDDMRKALRAKAEEWAKKNLHYNNEEDIKSRLKNMKGFIKDSAELTSSEAAERFSGDKSMQDKYLQHLRESEHRRAKKADESWEKGVFSGAANWMSRAYHNVTRDVRHNPKMAQENFLMQSRREKEKRDGTRSWGGYLSSRINLLDKSMNYGALSRQTESAKRDATLSYLRSGGGSKTKAFHDLMRREARESDANELARIRRLEGQGVSGAAGRVGSWESVNYGDLKKQAQERKAKLLEDVKKDFNDPNKKQTIFEKAARLSQLNSHFGVDRDPLKEISEALKAEAQSKANEIKSSLLDGSITKEEADIRTKELREKDFSIYSQDSTIVDAVLSDNLDKLEEKMKKDDHKLVKEEKTDKIRSKDESDDEAALKSQEEVRKKLEETSKATDSIQRLEDASKAAEASLAAGDVEKAKEEWQKAQQEAPIIASKMEVEFGSNISDALIKGGDVTIKGANVMIGGDNVGKKSDIDENLLNSLKLEKNQCDGRLKMAGLEKKIKEFELKQLHDKGNADPKAVDRLEKEISELEKDHNRLKTESARLEAGISSLRTAMS